MRQLYAGALALWLLACGHDHDHDHVHKQATDHPHDLEQSHVGCDGLTYKNTVKPFADKYCVRCHETPLVVRAAEVAPTGLDDEPSWLEHGGHALELLKARAMPLLPPEPSPDEVEKLARWLACEDALRPHSHDEGGGH